MKILTPLSVVSVACSAAVWLFVAGSLVIASGEDRTLPASLMTGGHLLTLALGVAIAYWALNFGTTGWELLLLPAALMIGQIVVAAGLILARRQRRTATA